MLPRGALELDAVRGEIRAMTNMLTKKQLAPRFTERNGFHSRTGTGIEVSSKIGPSQRYLGARPDESRSTESRSMMASTARGSMRVL